MRYETLCLHPDDNKTDERFGLSDERLQEPVGQRAKLRLDDGYIFGLVGSGFERINIACPRRTLEIAPESLRSALR